MFTRGFQALDLLTQAEAVYRIRHFKSFTPDNDPYQEHDFGKLKVNGQDILWKIDYYDRDCRYGSQNPSDLTQTHRVLTVMLANEY